ncbi:MAG: hypothetical protein M2R45_03234 [Verrucomicrobia subdivision 3 bacterium]|nr:hypothetical protein [Limisphaerales bacterium]MCS1416095.1 hypothetical protein [Limisphaerales bacterium]
MSIPPSVLEGFQTRDNFFAEFVSSKDREPQPPHKRFPRGLQHCGVTRLSPNRHVAPMLFAEDESTPINTYNVPLKDTVLRDHSLPQGTRPKLSKMLKQTGRSATSGVRSSRFVAGLVITEVALTLVFLTDAELMIRNMIQLLDVYLGYNSTNVLRARLHRPWNNYAKNQEA